VREHLCIGVGAKGDAGSLETDSQRRGIFDNAVVDHGNAICPIAMRMGIAVARLAVRRPAGVGNAG